jgi:hypothetical protein
LKLNASADKNKVVNSLYSLVYDFKRIGPSMHVDQVKALVGFNSTIACKTKSTTKKRIVSVSFKLDPLYLFLPNERNSKKTIHLDGGVIDWFSSLVVFTSMTAPTQNFRI